MNTTAPAAMSPAAPPLIAPSLTTRWRRLKRRLEPHAPIIVVSLLLTALLTALLWPRIFIMVQAGEAGVLWSRFAGTQIDEIYTEGLNIISPLDEMTIYEVRNQVATHSLDVLSREGLTLTLDLAIRYRPEYDLLGMLHERVGPEYLTRVVVPQTESVLRKGLGNASAEDIYTNANGLLTQTLVQAIEEIDRNFVTVEDIIIRRIELPEKVATAIENKIVQQQLLQSYAYRRKTAEQEAQRKRIEAAGIRDYQKIVDNSLDERLLRHQGITATQTLAASDNRKTVIIGAGDGVPVILDASTGSLAAPDAKNAEPVPTSSVTNAPSQSTEPVTQDVSSAPRQTGYQ